MKKLTRFFKYLLSGEFGKLFSALRERIPPWVYRHGNAYIFEKEKVSQDLNHKEPQNITNGFEFKICQRADLFSCSKLLGIPVEECYKRYDHGDFCFAAFQGNKIVNLSWFHHGPFYVRGFGYHENSNNNISYLYNLITDPLYRCKGLFKNSIYLISKILFEKGSSKIISIVMCNNQISVNTYSRIGFKKTYKIRHLAIFGIKYTAVEDLGSKDVNRKIFVKIHKGAYVI